jgi:hypothetical protein
MSEWTGKGSKSRVTNYSNYWNSALWDNKNKGKDKKFLFLDDVRVPRNAFLWDKNQSLYEASGIPEIKWDIVRSYDEFVEYIQKNGIPDVVSFDNDLWDVGYELQTNPTDEALAKQFQMIGWQEFDIKTGAHCAQYLVEACKVRRVPIPKYYIHTANSAARPIIKEILYNARNNS